MEDKFKYKLTNKKERNRWEMSENIESNMICIKDNN